MHNWFSQIPHAQLPQKFIEGVMKVGEMQAGDSGYCKPQVLRVDLHRYIWIDPDGEVYDKSSSEMFKIRFDGRHYEVTIGSSYQRKWKRQRHASFGSTKVHSLIVEN